MHVDDFLARLDCVRRSARGWSARCPAHEDKDPSLSVSEGDGGRILVKCFAGCTVKEIVAALNLTLADLFVENTASRTQPRRDASCVTREESNAHTTRTARDSRLLTHHAFMLDLRAAHTLTTASNLDIGSWTDDELDRALDAVARAYHDQERADLLREVAASHATRTKKQVEHER
jgi:DNA primase